MEGFSVTDDEIKRNEFYLYVNMKGPSTDLDDCPPDNISSDENLGNTVEVESTPLAENDALPPQKVAIITNIILWLFFFVVLTVTLHVNVVDYIAARR